MAGWLGGGVRGPCRAAGVLRGAGCACVDMDVTLPFDTAEMLRTYLTLLGSTLLGALPVRVC
jgi:hypothetical protein